MQSFSTYIKSNLLKFFGTPGKDTGYAWDERTVGMENLKLKAKTDTKG